MRATLRLFNALPIKERKGVFLQPEELLVKTIPKGFIFSSDVVSNYSNYGELIALVEKVIGIASSQANQTFHKSWAKVRDADIEQLVVEQWAHYLTTYGKQDPLGYVLEKGITHVPGDFRIDKLYDGDYVYIPEEVVEGIPDVDMGEMKLTVIKGYTKAELKEKLLKLLGTGIALKESTLNDVVDVALFVGVTPKDVLKIKNKEIRAILYDFLHMTPKNPVEFLRYLVYLSTNETLLIKSKTLIAKIKEKDNVKIVNAINSYIVCYGIQDLASIFYRFKPIWLAFRTNAMLKSMINRIRKLAPDFHVPMPEDYLNTVTAKLETGVLQDTGRLERELKKVNIFRKIRLAYALKFRTKDVTSIMYRIRNGKAYAKEFSYLAKEPAKVVLKIVLDSIVEDIKKNVNGKKILIPDYINYTLPATEKQFTGNLPSGSYVSVPQDMILGVHWNNVGNRQIDLDLSLMSPTTGKLGWDAGYRVGSGNILYSGDITTAPKPNGATECFYVKKQYKDGFVFFVNYYNFDKDTKVPYKIIVAKQKPKNLKENYMINPNNIVLAVQSEIDVKQKILGVLITTTGESRFYFAETSIGRSITSRDNAFSEHSRQYLIDFYENSIELKDILERAGAEITSEKSDAEREFFCDIDLSPENLEKDTIINLIKGA